MALKFQIKTPCKCPKEATLTARIAASPGNLGPLRGLGGIGALRQVERASKCAGLVINRFTE
jgi:hypothetical protein